MTVETSIRRRSLARATVRGGTTRPALVASPSACPMLATLATSGGVASCSRPLSAASSATPIRTEEVMPGRNVPESQRVDTSRRSGGRRPSPYSGGSLPSVAMALALSCIPSADLSVQRTVVASLLPRHLPVTAGQVNEWRRQSPIAGIGSSTVWLKFGLNVALRPATVASRWADPIFPERAEDVAACPQDDGSRFPAIRSEVRAKRRRRHAAGGSSAPAFQRGNRPIRRVPAKRAKNSKNFG